MMDKSSAMTKAPRLYARYGMRGAAEIGTAESLANQMCLCRRRGRETE